MEFLKSWKDFNKLEYNEILVICILYKTIEQDILQVELSTKMRTLSHFP
jgi:hypothetical protein